MLDLPADLADYHDGGLPLHATERLWQAFCEWRVFRRRPLIRIARPPGRIRLRSRGQANALRHGMARGLFRQPHLLL